MRDKEKYLQEMEKQIFNNYDLKCMGNISPINLFKRRYDCKENKY